MAIRHELARKVSIKEVDIGYKDLCNYYVYVQRFTNLGEDEPEKCTYHNYERFRCEQYIAFECLPQMTKPELRDDEDLYYTGDKFESACIGHFRFYFSGESFYYDFFDHTASLKTDWFKTVFDSFVNVMRECKLLECNAKQYGTSQHAYSTDDFTFAVRYGRPGDYSYIYCYDNKALANLEEVTVNG